jgi:hypothetical protein
MSHVPRSALLLNYLPARIKERNLKSQQKKTGASGKVRFNPKTPAEKPHCLIKLKFRVFIAKSVKHAPPGSINF